MPSRSPCRTRRAPKSASNTIAALALAEVRGEWLLASVGECVAVRAANLHPFSRVVRTERHGRHRGGRDPSGRSVHLLGPEEAGAMARPLLRSAAARESSCEFPRDRMGAVSGKQQPALTFSSCFCLLGPGASSPRAKTMADQEMSPDPSPPSPPSMQNPRANRPTSQFFNWARLRCHAALALLRHDAARPRGVQRRPRRRGGRECAEAALGLPVSICSRSAPSSPGSSRSSSPCGLVASESWRNSHHVHV